MPVPDNPEKKPGRKIKAAKAAENSISLTPANDAGVSVFGGCYQPADLLKWARMPFWTPMEAACLTQGFDPTFIEAASADELRLFPSTFEDLEYRYELFKRAGTSGRLSPHIIPIDAIRWLTQIGLPVPPDLVRILSNLPAFGRVGASQSTIGNDDRAGETLASHAECEDDEDFPSTKSGMAIMIASHEKLLLGIAHDAYGYAPHRSHAPVLRKISAALEKLQLKLSEDTIDRHLTRASDNHWLGTRD